MKLMFGGGKLHAVSGPEFTLLGKKPMGYIVDMNTGNLEGTWQVSRNTWINKT